MTEDTPQPADTPDEASQKESTPAPEENIGSPRPTGEKGVVAVAPKKAGLLEKINPVRLFKRDTPAALVKAGRALLENKNFAQASVNFNKALALAPDFVPAFQALGDALMKKGGRANVKSALLQFQEASKRDPFQEAAYSASARAYDMLGQRKEAALEKKKLVVVKTLDNDSNNPAANNNMGILFLQQGLMPQALGHFQRAIKTDRKYDVALRNLAAVYYKLTTETEDPNLKLEYTEKAKEYIGRAMEVAEIPASLLVLARIQVMEEQYDKALVVCEKIEAQDATNKDVFGLKKVILMKLNRLDEANKAYETYKFLAANK
ncbi:MAG: hypothetical protein IID61_04530 [SAR324 cluster bacterium]|nr:hypothetical protein [SAR324 cluster bacterium]